MQLRSVRRYRNFDPGLYHEVTQRIRSGKFLLDPNCPRLKEAIYGQMAIALRRYGVKLLALHFMSDHFHALYMIGCPHKFAKFLAFLHSGITRAYNRLRNEGIDKEAQETVSLWHEMKWLPVSTDEATVRWRLGYILGQAVAAGLVDHPIQFPGASTVDAMIVGEQLAGKTCDATARYRESRLQGGARDDEAYETTTELVVTPPHCWEELTPAELRQRYIEVADSVANVPFGRINASKRTVPVVATAAAERAGSHNESSGPLAEDGEPGLCQEPGTTGEFCEAGVQKLPIPERLGENGDPYEAGPPKPKASYFTAEGKKRRLPLILSRLESVRQAYAEVYSHWVARYVEAKEAYRLALVASPAGLRAAGLEIPPNFLLGSMPYPKTE